MLKTVKNVKNVAKVRAGKKTSEIHFISNSKVGPAMQKQARNSEVIRHQSLTKLVEQDRKFQKQAHTLFNALCKIQNTN